MELREEIITILKAHHLRLTKTRRALTEIFLHNVAPLSVLDILSALQKIQVRVNKTTVYRELERLQGIGMITRVHLGDRKQYYELVSRKHHHHLVCMRCETVEDIHVSEQEFLRETHKAKKEKKFVVLRHSLEFFGLCKMCS